ncbi:hypothetical protein D3C72_1293080 [compost metagenome]
MQGHQDLGAVAAQGLVRGVVDHLLHDMQGVVGPGVHAGALLDRLQALQDPDGRFAVLTGFARHGVATKVMVRLRRGAQLCTRRSTGHCIVMEAGDGNPAVKRMPWLASAGAALPGHRHFLPARRQRGRCRTRFSKPG